MGEINCLHEKKEEMGSHSHDRKAILTKWNLPLSQVPLRLLFQQSTRYLSIDV
jgi:hypothetical protein